jgi:DNA-directed RNA polymerase specialized sigma24 family protein
MVRGEARDVRPRGRPIGSCDRQGDVWDREFHRGTGPRVVGRRDVIGPDENDLDALVALVWREVGRILAETADYTTARRIVHSVFKKASCQLTRPDGEIDKEKILLAAAADLCIERLLEQAHADLSSGKTGSRSVDLIFAYFDPFIVRTVRGKVNRPCDIDHIANDVRWRVWCQLETFEGERRQLQRYFERACESACYDEHRRRTRRGPDGNPVEQVPLSPSHKVLPDTDKNERALESAEVRIELERRMDLLSDEQNAALELHRRLGSWVRAEEETGVCRQTWQSRFESACRILRRGFTDDQ